MFFRVQRYNQLLDIFALLEKRVTSCHNRHFSIDRYVSPNRLPAMTVKIAPQKRFSPMPMAQVWRSRNLLPVHKKKKQQSPRCEKTRRRVAVFLDIPSFRNLECLYASTFRTCAVATTRASCFDGSKALSPAGTTL